jgi:peptidoglycan/xylan/chitin deacetylase (PgdA/CDA1 family)
MESTMASRRDRLLIATALTLLLVGCTAADSAVRSTSLATRSVSPSPIASGQGAGGPVIPSPSTPLSPSPLPPSPTPSSIPALGAANGPAGSITTTGSAAVALTFDDGPGGNTAQVLDLLKRYGIHATFCIIGRMITPANAALIRRIVDEGHTLCNHTWTHDLNLKARSEDQIRSELQRTNDAIHAIVPNAPIRYFRNPGGNFSPLTVAVAKSMGMQSIYWAVDPRDWSRPGTQAIIGNVLSHTHEGSIVLMHDGGGDRSQTVQALATILPNLKSRFTLIPLPTDT